MRGWVFRAHAKREAPPKSKKYAFLSRIELVRFYRQQAGATTNVPIKAGELQTKGISSFTSSQSKASKHPQHGF